MCFSYKLFIKTSVNRACVIQKRNKKSSQWIFQLWKKIKPRMKMPFQRKLLKETCNDVMRRINLQRCSFGGFGYYRFMCRRCWWMGSQVNRVLQTFTDFRTSPKSASSPTGSESSGRSNVTKETDHRRHDGREWCSFLTNY